VRNKVVGMRAQSVDEESTTVLPHLILIYEVRTNEQQLPSICVSSAHESIKQNPYDIQADIKEQ
jgi:hypothetical protein